jgi:hypothetical protein
MVNLSEEQGTVLLGCCGQLLELFEALAFKGSIDGDAGRPSGADGVEINIYIASDNDAKAIPAFTPSKAVSLVYLLALVNSPSVQLNQLVGRDSSLGDDLRIPTSKRLGHWRFE